jgi:hypothetical protein
VLAGNPDPETATTVPGGPRTGARVRLGVPVCCGGVPAVGGVGCEGLVPGAVGVGPVRLGITTSWVTRAGGPLSWLLPCSRGLGAEKYVCPGELRRF